MATHDEIQALRLAIAVDPGSLALRLHLADQLAKAGRPKDALAEYQRVLAGQPDSPDALTGAEAAAAALDQTEQAASFRARRERPPPKAAPAPPTEEEVLQEIRDAAGAGNLARASERIAQALVEAPHDERLLRWRGYVHLVAGRHHEALREGIDTATRTPSDGWGHWLQGAALLELGRLEEAIVAAREGLRREPSNERLLEQGGRSLFLAKRHDEARDMALRLLRIAPDAPAPHRLLAVLAVQGGQWREAEARLRRAIELEPDVELFKALANVLWMSERGSEAVAVLVSCVDTYPADESARLQLRRYRRLLGRGPLALSVVLVLLAPAVAVLSATEIPDASGRATVRFGIVVAAAAFFAYLRARQRRRAGGMPQGTTSSVTAPGLVYALKILGALLVLVGFAAWAGLILEDPRRYVPQSPAAWIALSLLAAGAVASAPYLVSRLRRELMR